jgi:hypothetical protein
MPHREDCDQLLPAQGSNLVSNSVGLGLAYRRDGNASKATEKENRTIGDLIMDAVSNRFQVVEIADGQQAVCSLLKTL